MPGTTNFPTALDAANPLEPNTPENDPGKEHDVLHNNHDVQILALQAKVGIDGSAVTSSLDYKVAANATAIAARIPSTEKGAANGVATLGSDSKVPTAQLPALAITDVYSVASEGAQLALTAQEGDVAIRTDLSKSYIHNGGTAGTMADWSELLTPAAGVSSVAGKTGVVVLAAADIVSGNFDAARLATGSAAEGDVPTYQSDGSVLWAPQAGGGGGGGSVATDTIWDAAGDLAVGSGSNTAARLAKGSDGQLLGVASGAVTWVWGGYREGTAFPGSPTTGDKFYRTDRNILYFYDGTRWLSVQVFELPMQPTNTLQPFSATAALAFRAPVRKDYQIYLERWVNNTRVATTNNGSANWSMALLYTDAANADTSIATFSTGTTPDTAGAQVNHDVTSGLGLLSTNAMTLYISATRNNSPGSLTYSTGVLYRLVG